MCISVQNQNWSYKRCHRSPNGKWAFYWSVKIWLKCLETHIAYVCMWQHLNRKITHTVWSSVVTLRSSSCICRPTSLLYNTFEMKIHFSALISEKVIVHLYVCVPSWPGGLCPRCSETGAGWRWWCRSHLVSCGPGSPAWSALATLTSTVTQTGPCAPSFKLNENVSLGAHGQVVCYCAVI